MKLFSKPSTLLAAALVLTNLAHADISNLAITRPHTKDTNLKFSGVATSDGIPQHITLVDSGVGALKKRLDMVNSATKSIDVQYFIYNIDRTGRLFTQALIRKAKEGVKIRMLIDTSLAVFKLNSIFVDKIIREGTDKDGNQNIEIKYYNLTSIFNPVSLNFRSHRKLVLVDNKIAVTGGRNMADEYFGLSTEYNFLDTDFFIEGSIVPSMALDFEDFWNSPIVSEPKEAVAPPHADPSLSYDQYDLYERRLAEENKFRASVIAAEHYTVENDDDRALIEQINTNGAVALKEGSYDGQCTDVLYAADHPGIGSRDDTRVLANVLTEQVELEANKLAG